MRVLMVASEAAPYLRTGDVANVVLELSQQLRREGHDTRVVIPGYRSLVLGEESPRRIIDELDVPLGTYSRVAAVRRTDHVFDSSRELPVYLIDNPFYFGRENPYGYLIEYERFLFFSRAVLEMLCHPDFASEDWRPEVIHGHDWIAGLIPFWLRSTYAGRAELSDVAFAFTLHNAAFPGNFGYRVISVAGLPEFGIYESLGESANRTSFMARGILAADGVNTDSPTHAIEILDGSYAPEAAKALGVRGSGIRGILNGLDYTIYNPAFDSHIDTHFDRDRLSDRLSNKVALQESCGFDPNPDTPVLGMVSRLIAEKGIGLVGDIAQRLLEEDRVQLVILGTLGDYRYGETFTRLEERYPKQFSVFLTFDEKRARRISSGCDIILVPSLYEPCGLQQMIAMRYGAMPVVRQTGGLRDTVSPIDGGTALGEGFVFNEFDPECLLKQVRSALEMFRSDRARWEQLQRKNMAIDFSWEKSTGEYVQFYEDAIVQSRSREPLPRGTTISPGKDGLLIDAIMKANEIVDRVNQKEYLKDVAHTARELLGSDATLIWIRDGPASQRLRMGAYSFAPSDKTGRADLDMSAFHTFVERDARSWSWQYSYRRDARGSALQSQLGFLGSEVARDQSWEVQLTVPINTHVTVLGRLDAFSCDDREFSEWDIGALGALANTAAVNLEKLQLNEQMDGLLALEREMSQVRAVEDIVQLVVSYAREITRADMVRLYIPPSTFYVLKAGAEQAKSAIADPKETGGRRKTSAAGLSAAGSRLTGERTAPGILRVDLKPPVCEEVGVLEIVKAQPARFTRREEVALKYLAKQATPVLEAALKREHRDRRWAEQLGKLAAILVGPGDFGGLSQEIAETIAGVVHARAASLYLLSEGDRKLTVAAEKGGAGSECVERIAEWIADRGTAVRTKSLEELHNHQAWKKGRGRSDGGREPDSLLGVPLKVIDRRDATIIGVLQMEDPEESSEHPEPFFTDQDELLATMMANITATILHKARVNEGQLRRFSRNLEELSTTLVGGREVQAVVAEVVNTTARLLTADASSLYLLDEASNKLVIMASTGYQEQLVAAGVTYELGEGITGWIAQHGEVVRANNLEELHGHEAHKGKQNKAQGNREPDSFLGIPLKVEDRNSRKEKIIGVLKVEDIKPSAEHPESHFTKQDVLLVKMMANIIATVVYNTRVGEVQLEKLSHNLERLSSALAGGREMDDLVVQVVETMAYVLSAKASSLYLLDEASNQLVIKASTGYQKELVATAATYDVGEGITGWIAQHGRVVRANNLEELHSHEAHKGKQNKAQGGREPDSFLGIPLKVEDRYTRAEKIIGVLKVEDIKPSAEHPESHFTAQDVLLVNMMANIIATGVYNTQVSNAQLRMFSGNLEELSASLAGGHEMNIVVDQVVETTASVLSAEASSLYLIDEATRQLVIQAAAGYQKKLVDSRATYEPGEGITGWIAGEGKLVRANNLAELQRHPAHKGKQNKVQGREPKSFLGVPLKVEDRHSRDRIIGVLKVEDIKPSSEHPEKYFTDQDVLLVTMMANIIATVIHNTRQGENRMGEIMQLMGTLSTPIECVPKLLLGFAQSKDMGMVDQLAIAIVLILDAAPDRELAEIEALFRAQANPEVYRRIASRTQGRKLEWLASVVYDVTTGTNLGHWDQMVKIIEPWRRLFDHVQDEEAFKGHAHRLAVDVGKKVLADVSEPLSDGAWYASILGTQGIFGKTVEGIRLLLKRGERIEKGDLTSILSFATRPGRHHIVLLVSWGSAVPNELRDQIRKKLRERAVDIVFATASEMIQIQVSPSPVEDLRGLVLRQVTTVSPFVTRGPVPDQMFFGREQELQRIIEYVNAGSSCMIIGGRRTGKTSVLHRLHHVRLAEEGFRSLYFECATSTYEEILDAPVRDQDWRPEPPPGAPTTLGELVRSTRFDEPLVVLLDEADNLVGPDGKAGWPHLNALRALRNSTQVRLLLFGEDKLRQSLHDPGSPNFNLGDEVVIGRLEPIAIEALVSHPMRQLKIELAEGDEVVRRIADFTSGHPNVIQRLCSRLIQRLNEKDSRRVTPEDVEEVIKTPEFIRDDFLSTYFSRATALEHLCALLGASPPCVEAHLQIR